MTTAVLEKPRTYKFRVLPISTNEGLTNPTWKKKTEFSEVYTWAGFWSFDDEPENVQVAKMECVDYCGRNTGWKEVFTSEAQARKAVKSSVARALA